MIFKELQQIAAKHAAQFNRIEDKLNMVEQALTDLQTQVSRLSTDITNAVAKLQVAPGVVADADVEAQVAALAKAADALEAAVNPTVMAKV